MLVRGFSYVTRTEHNRGVASGVAVVHAHTVLRLCCETRSRSTRPRTAHSTGPCLKADPHNTRLRPSSMEGGDRKMHPPHPAEFTTIGPSMSRSTSSFIPSLHAR